MASTIKVDNVQNTPGTNIINKCGTTITLGASSDTVSLASGASQTGFGRTGTVDWVTTIKTNSDSPITSESGKGYFLNTTAGIITINLPTSPSAGDIVSIKDYARTFGSNAVTVGRGGSNMDGTAADGTLSTDGTSATYIYMDGTKGWTLLQDESPGAAGESYISATGGDSCGTSGNYKWHKFTGPGTFCVSSIGSGSPESDQVSYIVVAGGGGGGVGNPAGYCGGGGGAGGLREGKNSNDPYTASPLDSATSLTVTATGYPITVGGGGPAPNTTQQGGDSGSNSVFSTITSTGGGGGSGSCASCHGAKTGGSGGGGANAPQPNGAAGNTPPFSPPQGNPGGDGPGPTRANAGGGGGGATEAGQDYAPPEIGGRGGAGATSSISATPTAYAGGAGGSGGATAGAASPCGTGGIGANDGTNASAAGTINTGGGGGGGQTPGNPAPTNNASAGGSGIVIIRYKYQ
jgi:hypothetical protein